MKKNILFLILILAYSCSMAQTMPEPVNIQSPDAGGLAKFGDVPVSLYTGQPNIQIPLHAMSKNGIDLNISLNYDATGVRVGQHPGWVGQNWSLCAGGVITRTVRGNPDEYNTEGLLLGYPTPIGVGFGYQGGALNESQLSGEELRAFAPHQPGGSSVYNIVDYQPDIFTFNFMGKTGKFFFGNDGKIKVASESNLKVIMEQDLITPLFDRLGSDYYNGYYFPKVIGGFKIIDDQGTQYYFGYSSELETGRDAIEYSIDYFRQITDKTQWFANAWKLIKVKDKFDNTVYTFNYEREYFIADFYRSINNEERRFISDPLLTSIVKGFLVIFGGDYPVSGCNPSTSTKWDLIEGRLISPVYLKTIVAGGHTVNFTRDNKSEQMEYDNSDLGPTYQEHINPLFTQASYTFYLQVPNPYIEEPYPVDVLTNLHWAQLNTINVSYKDKAIKQIAFNYNNEINTDQRLCLESLDIRMQKHGFEPEKKQSYRFSYIDFDQLPNFLSTKTDHWGYYNGRGYSISSNQSQFAEKCHYGKRIPDPAKVQTGLLNKIIYPTGGWSYFEYEPNKYNYIVSADRQSLIPAEGIGGGTRIKKIINFDGSVIKERNFQYTNGILAKRPQYYWEDHRLAGYEGQAQRELSTFIFTNNSLIPISNSFGASVEYPEVKESLDDGSYTIYSYTSYENAERNFFDYPPINTLYLESSQFSQYSELNLYRGKLISEKSYDKNGNLIKESRTNMRDDFTQMELKYVVGTDVSVSMVCPNFSGPIMIWVYKGNAYKLYYFDYDISGQETEQSLGSQQLNQKVDYSYIDFESDDEFEYRLLKEVEKTNSDNSYSKETYFYPHELDGTEPLMADLLDAGRINEKVVQRNTIDNSANGYSKTIYKTEENRIVPDMIKTGSTDENGAITTMHFDKYHSSGKPVTFYNEENDEFGATIWGYGGELPVASLQNASYADIQPYISDIISLSNADDSHCFNSGSCNEKLLRDKLEELRLALPEAMVTYATYDPGIGITSITSPDGLIKYYSYDAFNELEAVYDHNEHIFKSYERRYTVETCKGLPEIDISETIFDVGAPICFKSPGIIGGSDDQTFHWQLKRGQELLTGTSSGTGVFDTNLPVSGPLQISCEVTDNELNLSKSTSTNFTVSHASNTVEFTSIEDFIPTYTNGIAQIGVIESEFYDILEIKLVSRVSDPNSRVSFRVGENEYELNPYQTETIFLEMLPGIDYTCFVMIEDGLTGAAAEIVLQSLQYHTNNLGNSILLHTDVD